MSSSYRNSLNQWLSTLDVRADRVLDIGGAQEKLPGRVKSWQVVEYQVADLEQPHADSPPPDLILDLNKTDPGYFEHDIDLIFCLEVFEYIWNPVIAMQTIAKYLSKQGSAWVTFPSFYPLHNPVEEDCLRYMPAGIKKLAQAAGLEIVQMIPRRPETSTLLQYFSAERLRAARGEDHLFMGYIVQLRHGSNEN